MRETKKDNCHRFINPWIGSELKIDSVSNSYRKAICKRSFIRNVVIKILSKFLI